MMIITVKTFYKVIVLAVDILETTIADERHFETLEGARAFADDRKNQGFTCVVVQI